MHMKSWYIIHTVYDMHPSPRITQKSENFLCGPCAGGMTQRGRKQHHVQYNCVQAVFKALQSNNIYKKSRKKCSMWLKHYSTLHADSPLSAKLRGKFSAPRIYQYFRCLFSSEFSQFFFHGHFTDRQKINSANCGKMAAIDDFNFKLHLANLAIGNLCALHLV